MFKWLLFASMMHWGTQLSAQEVILIGSVTSAENGLPIPGVTVQLKGLNQGSITDTLGRYSITANRNSTVIFRAMGWLAFEVMVPTNQHRLDVQLKTDITDLKEVMVNGYSSSAKDQTTGAYTIINSGQVENSPFISLDKALQGLVPGLQSTGGSGLPGSFQGVRIRGTGSLNAGSEPLYVINGIPINAGVLALNNPFANTLAGININDVQQVTVLKDAVAASAYGSRAANGVIVITMKPGKAGNTRFQFSSEVGFVKQAYSSTGNRPLTTSEWRTLTAEGVRNRYPQKYPDVNSATQYVDETFLVDPAINTSWLDEITQKGHIQQYHLSSSGGNDKTQFYLSAGYLSQTGNVIATGLKRFTGNMTLGHKAGKRITFRTAMILGSTSQFGPDNGGDFANPVLAAYFLRPSLSPRISSGKVNISSPDFPLGALYNPLAIAEMDSRNTANLKGILSNSVDYQILKQLKITSRSGIDYNTLEEDSYNNPFYGNAVNEKGLSTRGYARYFNWVWSNLAEYNQSFSDNNYALHLHAGYEAQKSQHYFNRTVASGLPPHPGLNVPSAGATILSGEGSNSDYAFVSALGFLDFSIRQKLLFSGSFRRDGSSRFGSERRHGNFWSVGMAWHIDRESFFEGIPLLYELKLRGSYGVNGNASIGNYNWQAAYGYGSSYNYLGNTGSAPLTPGNKDLSWEFNKPLNLGLDASVLNGRLRLVLDWYNRITSNLLIDEPLSGTSGFTNYKNNAGSMRNRGLEIGLSGNVMNFGHFSWNLFLNMSLNKNRILSLPGGRDIVAAQMIRRVGQDMQSFYMRRWAGVNPQTGAPRWYRDAEGKEIVEQYNDARQDIVGSASPRAFGSFGSVLQYHGLCLDFQFYFSYGHMVRDAWATYTQSDGYNANFNSVASQLARWQKPGDITDVPKYVFGGNNASNALSSRFLYQGDYLRLRNVTLSWRFPNKFLVPIGLRNLKLYLRGTNVLTWVRDQKLPYDPETDLTSTTNFDVFIPKTFSGGLQLDF